MASKSVDFEPPQQPRSRQPTGFHVPAPIANFKGSFVYKDTTTPIISEPLTRKSGISDWALRLREGWTDVGIWKSAV